MNERAGKYGLTPTEYEVLLQLVLGKSNPQIGLNMHISPHTVKIHVARILEKFEVHNRIQATAKAIREDLVDEYFLRNAFQEEAG